jgi:hypothetical protein
MAKNEVAVNEQKTNLPADEFDYGKYEGAGQADASELLIPFLGILHYSSPQVDKASPRFIKGAEPGMILNSATGELMEKFQALIVATEHNYVKYIPRDDGGGFEGILAPDDPLVLQLRSEQSQFGALKLDGGKRELIETYYTYVFAKAFGPAFRAIVGYKSTQIKRFKAWRTLNNEFKYEVNGRWIQPPVWSHMFEFSSVPDSNKKGKFFSWKIEPRGGSKETAFVSKHDPIWAEAAAMHDSLGAGKIKANYAAQAQEPVDEDPF